MQMILKELERNGMEIWDLESHRGGKSLSYHTVVLVSTHSTVSWGTGTVQEVLVQEVLVPLAMDTFFRRTQEYTYTLSPI